LYETLAVRRAGNGGEATLILSAVEYTLKEVLVGTVRTYGTD